MTVSETVDNRWTDTQRQDIHYFPIHPCRAAGGQGLRGFVVPNRPTLPVLIILNNQAARPRSMQDTRSRQLSQENESTGRQCGSKETTATSGRASQGIRVQQSTDKWLQGCFLCAFRLPGLTKQRAETLPHQYSSERLNHITYNISY